MEDFLDHNAAFKERISGLFTRRLFFRMENVSGNGSRAITLELIKKEAKVTTIKMEKVLKRH